jgi:peroxiredoxin
MLLVASATAAMATGPRVGQPAPDFQLTLVDGTHVRLSELRGQVVVLNFWATWCVPCRAELPMLDGYYRIVQRHGLRVFAATTEDSVPLDHLRRVFAAMAIGAVRNVRGPYRPIDGAVPTNFVIDRAGRVRYAAAGAFDLDALNRILVPLLNEPAP